MTSNIKMISTACSVPVRISLADVHYIVLHKIFDPFYSNSQIMAHFDNGKRHEEEICFCWIIGDEVTVHQYFLEVKFTGIASFWLVIDW